MQQITFSDFEIRIIVSGLDRQIAELKKDIEALLESSTKAQSYIPITENQIELHQELIKRITNYGHQEQK